jgi:hypothetical protein
MRRTRRMLTLLTALSGVPLLLVTIGTAPASAATSAIAHGCFQDPSISIKVCIYMDGTAISTGGPSHQAEVTVKDYRYVVTTLDPLAEIDTLKMQTTVEGHCVSGCANYQDGQIWTKTIAPKTGHTYQYAMPWHASWVDVDEAGGGAQAATAIIHYTNGEHVLNYQTPNVCEGSLVTTACNF